MRRTTEQFRSRRKIPHRIIAVALMAAVIVSLLSLTVFTQNSFVITDGDFMTVHKSYSTDPDVVLDEAGIELSEEDTYTTSYNDGIGRIDIQRMQMEEIEILHLFLPCRLILILLLIHLRGLHPVLHESSEIVPRQRLLCL